MNLAFVRLQLKANTLLFISLLVFSYGMAVGQTCNSCNHTIGATGGPSPAIPNNANGITVCINANRTSAINFNNAQNVTVCIAEGVTVNADFNSLSSLSTLNNLGTFTARADYNGNWVMYNFGTMTVNFENLNSNKTIVSAGTFNKTGNFVVNGNLDSFGVNNITGNLQVNSGGYFNNGSNCVTTSQNNPYQQGGEEFIDRMYVFTCSTYWTVPNNTETEELVDAVEFLVVAGGGGGGIGSSAGGGGAGGLIEKDTVLALGSTLMVIRGFGGAGSTNTNARGQNGTNSSFLNFTAVGGGGGGSNNNGARNGNPGGSGGGGAWQGNEGNGGGRTAAQGNIGGNGRSSQGSTVQGAGGGGAGGPGSVGNNQGQGQSIGGDGGPGIANLISGTNIVYSAGGGGTATGGNGQNSAGSGGSGVGGNGNNSGAGGNGTTPGSAGGAGSTRGGNGANGIVIISQTFKILPVEFIHVSAEFSEESRNISVAWAIAKEWENSHFEIERSIDNVKSFEKIGEVEGIGYTDERSDYNFNDKSLPLNGGMAYYRLKQVDFSGSFSYSDIIGVRIPSMAITNGIWRAYPNPTKGNKLNIDLVNSQEYSEEPITARLVSSLVGSVLIEGSTIQEVSEKLGNKLQTSPNGIYVIEVHWGQKREYLKVLKN